MGSTTEPVPNIGPHEDRELELMLAGKKPLAMFTELSPIETGLIPEAEFAPYVSSGRVVMREALEPANGAQESLQGVSIRRVLYALPGEVWRIEAMLLVCQVANRLARWDEGLERVIGKLLGYEDRQIEAFIRKLGKR
jgi:hypothetical protein